MSQNQFIDRSEELKNPETQELAESKIRNIFDPDSHVRDYSDVKHDNDENINRQYVVNQQNLEAKQNNDAIKSQQNEDDRKDILENNPNDSHNQNIQQDVKNKGKQQLNEFENEFDVDNQENNFHQNHMIYSSKVNSGQGKSKNQKEQESFRWGQEEDSLPTKQKRTYSDFFMSSKLAVSQQLFIPIIKNSQKQMNDSDIWQDLRNEMLQKSRASKELQISRNLSNLSKEKSNSKKIGEPLELEEKKRKKSPSSQKITRKKQGILIGRQKQKQEAIKNIENMKKMILEKVKVWKKEQRQIEDRRKVKIEKEQQQLKIQKIRQVEEIKKRKNEEKQRRVKAISDKLFNKVMLQNFSERIEDEVQKQKQKFLMQKKKLKKVKSEVRSQKLNKSIERIEKKQEKKKFQMHWNKSKVEDSESKQKLQRRKRFQQRLKDIPININQNKRLKKLIQIDKSQNSLKYQILSKKGLSDEEIFKNHKQFKIGQNTKKIGIQYLQNLREKNKLDDLRRYMSQQSILNIKKHERNWKSPLLNQDSHRF